MKNCAWISNSGGPNRNHRRYIQELQHKIIYVDTTLTKWRNSSFLPKKIIFWFANAVRISRHKECEILVSNGIHLPLAIGRALGLLRKVTIIGFHANESLYSIKVNRYSYLNKKVMIQTLKSFDFHICISQMNKQILEEITGYKVKNVYSAFNGFPSTNARSYNSVIPSLESFTLVFVGSFYANWRKWVKGLDIILNSFKLVNNRFPNARFIIVGKKPHDVNTSLTNNIEFVGEDYDLSSHFAQSSLYVHPARGEAFGISIVEAMACGVPTLVSEWTGAKEVVAQVDEKLILPLSAQSFYEGIVTYFSKSIEEKRILSRKSREISKNYTQELAIENLKKIFSEIGNSLRENQN